MARAPRRAGRPRSPPGRGLGSGAEDRRIAPRRRPLRGADRAGGGVEADLACSVSMRSPNSASTSARSIAAARQDARARRGAGDFGRPRAIRCGRAARRGRAGSRARRPTANARPTESRRRERRSGKARATASRERLAELGAVACRRSRRRACAQRSRHPPRRLRPAARARCASGGGGLRGRRRCRRARAR